MNISKLIILIFLSLSIAKSTLGQNNKETYLKLIKTAETLYANKNYLNSGEKYSEAFIALGGKGYSYDRYNAACSWALANKPDSAFVQLFKIAKHGNYTNYNHITTDPDLNPLHSDPRWEELIQIIKINKEKAEANLDKQLVAILDTVYQDDQKYRHQINEVAEKYGWKSKEMNELWDIIDEKDSINLIKVKKILDEKGWLGPDIIGQHGNTTLFLVIQHADLETQEKYLPMMREAVKKGNAQASSLALLEDRVALRQGKRQIYGSQIGQDPETGEYYVLPLIDPKNVDKRRAEVGLRPLQEYLIHWGMTWNVDEYIKRLPEIEAKQKQ